MITIDKIKYYLLRTRFAKYIREIESRLVFLKMLLNKAPKSKSNTVLCISPYKTGTTFLSSLFNDKISKHEPLHYFSFKILNKNFDKYFLKRMHFLNLKLECSGLWSVYVEELANNETSKKLNFICILRPPSSWITSVINYWNEPFMLKFHYDIQQEFYWKEKVGVDLREFNFDEDNERNDLIINKLKQFYFDFLEKTRKLDNITYIRLRDIGESIPFIETLINEKASIKDGWKRENRNKRFIYKNDKIDEEYERVVQSLIDEQGKISNDDSLLATSS